MKVSVDVKQSERKLILEFHCTLFVCIYRPVLIRSKWSLNGVYGCLRISMNGSRCGMWRGPGIPKSNNLICKSMRRDNIRIAFDSRYSWLNYHRFVKTFKPDEIIRKFFKRLYNTRLRLTRRINRLQLL